jgi:ABC-type dipeptide/oligopeptide/nickel transport system ATPase subunit
MPVLAVKDLKKHFPVRKGLLRRTVGQVYAVDGISFSIGVGETLGLVGESGCGKTTAGRAVLRLVEPTSGSIEVDGTEITGLSKAEMRPYRRQMQIIFQDPFSSLNPRMTAGDIVGEPLLVHGVANTRERAEQVAALFARVGLRPAQMINYPHQFSGGQRQRIGIARALALGPKLIVGDEPVSALDVSIQAQVINLLQDLKAGTPPAELTSGKDFHYNAEIFQLNGGIPNQVTIFTDPIIEIETLKANLGHTQINVNPEGITAQIRHRPIQSQASHRSRTVQILEYVDLDVSRVQAHYQSREAIERNDNAAATPALRAPVDRPC